MQIFLEATVALLATIGLLGLGWLLFGRLLAPIGAKGQVCAVITASGDGETLEHDVQGLLWLRGGNLAQFTIVIGDAGLSDQGRILALFLCRRESGVELCPLGHLDTYLKSMHRGMQR